MTAPLSILVVRFSSLGDVILTTPLLRAVARRHPGAAITFVTKARYAPVVAANPFVREVVTLEPGGSLRALARRLRAPHWDHRLDLHGSLRSRALRVLVGGPWTTYRKGRVRRAMQVTLGIGRHDMGVPVAERYFRAARALGAVPDGRPAEVAVTRADNERAAAIAPRGAVVLAPGAAHATKRWPAEHWRALAARLAAVGERPVAVGLAHERAPFAGAPVIDAFGEGLGVTAALCRRARVVVANDSGLMHLATAVGTPVVALFGPTVPALGFRPYRAPAVVLERPLPCRPCSVHGGRRCPRRHHRCMTEIEPADVAAALPAA